MSAVSERRFLVFQSMWAMELRASSGVERAREDSVAMIAAAGFDGVSADWTNRADVRRLSALLKAEGLSAEGLCFPRTVDDLKPILDNAVEFGLHHICAQPDVRPPRLQECIPLLDGWRRLAEEARVPLYFETHRGRMTNDLHFTLDLLDCFPDLKFVADLSHYVVEREMLLPIPDEHQAMLRRILDSAGAFHGRVSSSEQIQLELLFPHNRPWVEQFLDWWGQGFRSWCEAADAGDTLAFTCELGPRPYAVLDRNGEDTTDRWQESLTMMQLVRDVWSKVEADAGTGPRIAAMRRSGHMPQGSRGEGQE